MPGDGWTVLKVYVDPAWLHTGERLLPLARCLFAVKEQGLPTFRDEFSLNMRFEGIELVERVADCDFLFLPVNYTPAIPEQFAKLVRAIEEASVRHGKPVVVQSHSEDVTNPAALDFPFTWGIFLNSSLVHSLAADYFHALPYFIPDCLERYFGGRLTVLAKETRPSVGFCGVAAPLRTPFDKTKLFDALRMLLTVVDDFGFDSEKLARKMGTNMKHAHRARALMTMKYSRKIKTDFILRSQGGLVNKNYTNIEDMDPYNTEFYDNLNRNLYSLCSRGTENYSVRFYETFCMGRIPVLLDTDVSLPFQSQIDYERHCVWVQKQKIRLVDDLILRFHASKSNTELSRIQHGNRAIWEDYFSHQSFFKKLVPTLSCCESDVS